MSTATPVPAVSPPDPPANSTLVPNARYDVFLSYNSRERDLVRQIRDKLLQANLNPFMDVSGLEQGGDFSANLQTHMGQCASCAVFIGANGFGRYHQFEATYAGNQSINDPDFPTFPVFLPGCPDNPDLTAYLLTRSRIDFRADINDPETLQQLICAIRQEPYHPNEAAVSAVGENPYQGLEAFDESKQRFFFGRTDDVHRMLDKLEDAEVRFLATVGASGSGKSSIVRAGLVPALRNAGLPGSQTWAVVTLKPDANPLASLAAQFVPLLAAHTAGSEASLLDAVVTDMRANAHGLHNNVTMMLAHMPDVERVLLIVDQFEEVFTLCPDEATRRAFIDNLVYAATAPGGKCAMVLTLRADFYARCTTYRDLANLLATHQYIVSPMDEAGLRAAIEKPAQAVGLTFQTGLVDIILADVTGQPGVLPLLQYALSELWKRRDGTMLTLRGYQDSGGVTGAMAKRAEAIYAAFTPRQQEIAEHVLLRLTQPGEGSEDTRRRATLSELVTRPEEESAVEGVVHILADARLLTIGAVAGIDVTVANSSVEVAHEALIRGWGRLHKWINEDRDLLRLRGRITDAAGEWERAGKRPDYLFTGARLAEATEKRKALTSQLNPLECAFLDASVFRQVREHLQARRRTEWLIGSSVAAAVIFSLLALFGFAQSQTATAQKRVAQGAQATAVANGDAAATSAAIADTQKIAAQMAQGTAVANEDTAATSEARAATNARAAATSAAQAGTERDNAVTQRNAADAARTEADRQRKTAAAGEMAANALTQLDVDPELSLMLARHAIEIAPDNAQAQNALRAALAASRVRVTIPHFLELSRATFSGDHEIVAFDTAFSAHIWNVQTGQEVLAHEIAPNAARSGTGAGAPEDLAIALTLNPDGTRMVYQDGLGTMQVRDVRNDTRLFTLIGHNGVIYAAAFSPDGRRLVSAGADKTVRVWDMTTGKEMRQLPHTNEVLVAAFSPDGTRIVTAGLDNNVRVWNADSGDLQLTLMQPGRSGNAAFSSDASRIVTACSDDIARLWDARTGALLRELPKSETRLAFAALSPDGHYLATSAGDGGQNVRLWDAPSGQELRVFVGHDKQVASAAFSADSTHILTASRDGTARLWNLATDDTERVFTGTTVPVTGIAFSADGKRVTSSGFRGVEVADADTGGNRRALANSATTSIAASRDGSRIALVGTNNVVEIRDFDTGDLLHSLTPKAAIVLGAAWSNDGTRLITFGFSESETDRPGQVTIWNVDTGEQVRVLPDLHGIVFSAAFSPDGRRVVVGGSSGTEGLLRVFDADTGLAILSVPAVPKATIESVRFSPDGNLILVSDDSGNVQLRDAGTGEVRPTAFSGHTASSVTATFNADGSQILSAGADGSALVWDARTGETLFVLRGHSGKVTGAAFSPDGTRVVTGGEDGTTRVWDITTRERTLPLGIHDGLVTGVAFSPDGALAVTTGPDGAQIRDTHTGALIRSLAADGPMQSVAFSPDGKFLAIAVAYIASSDKPVDFGYVQIWRADTGEKVRALKGGKEMMIAVAYSPSGQLVAEGGTDHTIRLWSATTGSLVQTFDVPGDTINSVAFSPDNARLLTADAKGNIVVREIATGKQLVLTVSPSLGSNSLNVVSVESAVFSPDGARVLTASNDGEVRIWDLASGQVIFTLPIQSGGAEQAVFSPDGLYIVTGSRDGATRLWLTATGREIASISNAEAPAHRIAVSPDGTRVLVAQGNEGYIATPEFLQSLDALRVLAGSRITRAPTATEQQQYGLPPTLPSLGKGS